MGFNHAEWQREWRKRNPEKLRAYSRKHRLRHPDVCKSSNRNCKLKKAYGISTSDFDELLKAQGGVCAICKQAPSRTAFNTQRLHVDHNHGTGKIRGLLCLNCNRGIGAFQDNFELLHLAATYLEKHDGG